MIPVLMSLLQNAAVLLETWNEVQFDFFVKNPLSNPRGEDRWGHSLNYFMV